MAQVDFYEVLRQQNVINWSGVIHGRISFDHTRSAFLCDHTQQDWLKMSKALPYTGQKQKQKWIITPWFTHFCGFHPPAHTNKNKNNSDFIFVGPQLITYLQQKWISFLLAFVVNKNENNFEDSMT